jgi:hypothetical protein
MFSLQEFFQTVIDCIIFTWSTKTTFFSQVFSFIKDDHGVEPIIYVNGFYNLQFSLSVGGKEGGCLRQKHLFHLLPLMNAETNASFLYHRIKGGIFELGKYREDVDGIHSAWSETKPIKIVAVSYGCDVVVELINILKSKGLDPSKMISQALLLNPHFASVESNYIYFHHVLATGYIIFCNLANTFPVLKSLYHPRDTVLSKIKISQGNWSNSQNAWDPASCYKLCGSLQGYQLDGKYPFRICDSSSRDEYRTSSWEILKHSNVTLVVKIGIFHHWQSNLATRLLEIVSRYLSLLLLYCLHPKIILKSPSNLIPFQHVFDGMSLYDYGDCKINGTKFYV